MSNRCIGYVDGYCCNKTGSRCRMENGSEVPAVRMGKQGLDAFTSSRHRNPLARIRGKNGSEWYMTKAIQQIRQAGRQLMD